MRVQGCLQQGIAAWAPLEDAQLRESWSRKDKEKEAKAKAKAPGPKKRAKRERGTGADVKDEEEPHLLRTASQVPLTLESVIIPHSHPAFEKAEEEDDGSDAPSGAAAEGHGTAEYSAASEEDDPFDVHTDEREGERRVGGGALQAGAAGRAPRAQPAPSRKRAAGPPPQRAAGQAGEGLLQPQPHQQPSPPKPHTKAGGRPLSQGHAAAPTAATAPLTPLAQSAADRFTAVESAAREKAVAKKAGGKKAK